jgi:hypothetical protein
MHPDAVIIAEFYSFKLAILLPITVTNDHFEMYRMLAFPTRISNANYVGYHLENKITKICWIVQLWEQTRIIRGKASHKTQTRLVISDRARSTSVTNPNLFHVNTVCYSGESFYE